MAKFINNSSTAQKNRRAAAEGLNLAAVKAAIQKISEAARAAVDREGFGFSEGDLPSKNHQEMAATISCCEAYSGGYMYGGGYATVIGDPHAVLQYRTHSVRDYDDRDPEGFEANNLATLKGLEEGTTLRLGYRGQNSSYEEWVLEEGVWVHTLAYSGVEARWQEENLCRGVYLFSGIRAAVAAELRMEADYGFHRSFDEAVCLLDE